MPVLVGDVIIAARSIIPDMPGVVPVPPAPTLTPTTGGSLPAATYYLRFSVTTPWGESSCTAETSVILSGANNAINITLPGNILPLGTATLRVYFGASQGAENQFTDITSLPYKLTTPGTSGIVPNINRAYLPDTDGAVFPAITVYGWLRDALKQMGNLTGGIYDTTGVTTNAAIAMYQLTGDWKRMTHAWVDGWVFNLANKGEIFYRNKITTSGSGIVVVDTQAANSIVEYYPVPSRNGGVTTITTDIPASSATLLCADLSGFLLQYGLALIGSYGAASPEIIAYQLLDGNNLTFCLRGLGGTRAAAWPNGTTVSELNARFAGYRYPTLPRVGDSAAVLDVPPGWDVIIQLYMESRYREAERRFSDAKQLRDAFTAECRALASSNRGMLGPRQVGEVQVNEVYSAGLGGGWLLP